MANPIIPSVCEERRFMGFSVDNQHLADLIAGRIRFKFTDEMPADAFVSAVYEDFRRQCIVVIVGSASYETTPRNCEIRMAGRDLMIERIPQKIPGSWLSLRTITAVEIDCSRYAVGLDASSTGVAYTRFVHSHPQHGIVPLGEDFAESISKIAAIRFVGGEQIIPPIQSLKITFGEPERITQTEWEAIKNGGGNQ